jgi:hypothetical protein
MGRKGATLMQTKFKQLLLLLLIGAQVSWLGVAHSKDSSGAPSLLLANELGPNVDPAKYFISEKYDGVRAIWDGKMLRFAVAARSTLPHGLLPNCRHKRWMASFGWRAGALRCSPGSCARPSRKMTNGGRSNT